MVFMIQDFVASLTDWNGEVEGKSSVSELYAKTWTECRNFVLPMNPVRKELEYAVKTALSELGVKSRSTGSKPAAQKNALPQIQPKKSGNSKSGSSRHTGRL
jgi:poly(A) polymerase